MQAQGWYRDPYHVHQDRYFSVGQPTKLVRDADTEAYDPPPMSPPYPLIEVLEYQPIDGSALRRADDLAAGPVTYDHAQACYDALDAEAGSCLTRQCP